MLEDNEKYEEMIELFMSLPKDEQSQCLNEMICENSEVIDRLSTECLFRCLHIFEQFETESAKKTLALINNELENRR